jgi:ABC-2 type transporter
MEWVHKIHMSTGLPDDAAGRWPLDRTSCMRLPQRLRLDEVGGTVKPLTEILEQDDAQPEELERYRRPLTRLASTLFPLPRMFSLDVMLSSGGGLRFLEANTHPGTLAQPELQGSETPLNRYITFLLETDFDPDRQASALWRWRHEEGREVWGDLRQGEPDGRLDVTPALAFAILGMIYTSLISTIELLSYFFALVITPLFLFGGIFSPFGDLPAAARWFGWFTPLYHGVELLVS